MYGVNGANVQMYYIDRVLCITHSISIDFRSTIMPVLHILNTLEIVDTFEESQSLEFDLCDFRRLFRQTRHGTTFSDFNSNCSIFFVHVSFFAAIEM